MVNFAWQHLAINWTNADLPQKLFYGMHLRTIPREVFMDSIRNMFGEYTVKILPWDNESMRNPILTVAVPVDVQAPRLPPCTVLNTTLEIFVW